MVYIYIFAHIWLVFMVNMQVNIYQPSHGPIGYRVVWPVFFPGLGGVDLVINSLHAKTSLFQPFVVSNP